MLALFRRPPAVHEKGVPVSELHEALVPIEPQNRGQLAARGHLAGRVDARPERVRPKRRQAKQASKHAQNKPIKQAHKEQGGGGDQETSERRARRETEATQRHLW